MPGLRLAILRILSQNDSTTKTMTRTIPILACLLSAGGSLPAQPLMPDDFNPKGVPVATSTALQPDGRNLICSGAQILRLDSTGVLEETFHPILKPIGGVEFYSRPVAVQADGRILVGGHFAAADGQSRTNLVRLHEDGTLDLSFDSQAIGDSEFPDGTSALAVQADGKILVSEGCAYCTGALVRLNPDGTRDPGFVPVRLAFGPQAMSIQTDGKILISGYFADVDGVQRRNIARLNPDGTFDEKFAPGVDGPVRPLFIQADGKILLFGSFSTVAGQPRTNIARLNSDASLDASFNTSVDSWVNWCAIQTDGKIVLGGSFKVVNGQRRVGLARLHPDGRLDSDFNAEVGGSAYPAVSSLSIQADGKILVAGEFTTLARLPRTNIGRLNNTGPATQNLSYDGSTIVWRRGGTSPEVWRTDFQSSGDGVTWMNLGAGRRVPGGWQLATGAITKGATIRARGFIAGGGWGEGAVQASMQVSGPPSILTDDGVFGFHSGQFGFTLARTSGQSVVMESSTDLVSWQPLLTNSLSGALLPITDSKPREAQRFYRVQIQ